MLRITDFQATIVYTLWMFRMVCKAFLPAAKLRSLRLILIKPSSFIQASIFCFNMVCQNEGAVTDMWLFNQQVTSLTVPSLLQWICITSFIKPNFSHCKGHHVLFHPVIQEPPSFLPRTESTQLEANSCLEHVTTEITG